MHKMGGKQAGGSSWVEGRGEHMKRRGEEAHTAAHRLQLGQWVWCEARHNPRHDSSIWPEVGKKHENTQRLRLSPTPSFMQTLPKHTE